MIAYLKGKLAHKEPAYAIIECNGVGYKVKISLNTYSALGNEELVQLHTVFIVREDAQELFGFKEIEEKTLFEQLISISGVGGNTAMTILSSVSARDLHNAIQNEDIAALKRVKGIGPKTAGRIILELKGKLKSLDGDASPASMASFQKRDEAIAALTSLGFPKTQMEKKVDAILSKDAEATVENIIKAALKG